MHTWLRMWAREFSCGVMGQGSGMVTAAAWVAATVQVQSLAGEHPQPWDGGKKKKKKKERKRKTNAG